LKDFSTDVLVVGGGLAGCWAAHKASETGARVLLVDKGWIGASGCSTFAGGDILWWTPEDDLQEWLNNYARWGGYLFDPEWFVILCRDIHERILEMDRWGAPFEKDGEGNLLRKPGRGHHAAVVFPGVDLMKFMRRKAVEAGAKLLDRVMITDLVVEDGQLAGAVGFHIRDGEFCLIRAKAVVLAAGGCSWKGNYFGQDMVCGESYALAYRHGAELMHMEYSNNYNSSYRHFDIYGMSRFQRLGGKFTNALGERFMPRYDQEMADGAHLHTLALAMAGEVREGRGPVYFDLREMGEDDRRLSRKLLPMLFDMFEDARIDVFNARLEWLPGFQGSVATGSGIRFVDHSCASTLEGLYAAGDAAAEGLVIGGIAGPGAINLSWAIMTGYRAGEGAARFAETKTLREASGSHVRDLEERTFRFSNKEGGGTRPQEAYDLLQGTVIGWDRSIVRHEVRLEAGLDELERLRLEVMPGLKADDPHQLMRAHEVAATLVTTEMVLRSALLRTESRAAHYREDYPETDHARWLKWILLKKDDEGMRLSTVDVPRDHYERYRVPLPVSDRRR